MGWKTWVEILVVAAGFGGLAGAAGPGPTGDGPAGAAREAEVRRTPPAPELVASLERSLRDASPGPLLGAAICWRLEGEPLVAAGHGWARAPYEETAPSRPMGPFTVVPGASTGKSVTAATLLTALHRAGRDADTPIVELLPADWGPFDPRVEAMTVAHLLSHTSGFDFRDVYYKEDVTARVREVLEVGPDRSPGGDPGAGLWYAGQGPPPPDWAGSVYSNVNYFAARVLTEQVTAMPFEDAVDVLILEPAGLDWSTEAGPEPRTLGYSMWMPGAPGSTTPDSFRGEAGASGWYTSACGLADGAWALLGTDLLAPKVRDAIMTREMGFMVRPVRGLPVWVHSGVWTPGGRQGFELGLGMYPGGVTGGFATNTWANVWGERMLHAIWDAHTPVVEVAVAGPGSARITARYDRVPGSELRWSIDPHAPLHAGTRLEDGVVLPARGTVRVAAFLDGRWASLPLTVSLGMPPEPSPDRPAVVNPG